MATAPLLPALAAIILLFLARASAEVTSLVTLSAPLPAGGNGTVISITNDLGPTAVSVSFRATQVTFSITYYAADAAALNSLVAAQPTAATSSPGAVSLALVGATSRPATQLGGSCTPGPFSAAPPCVPLTYTPSTSASATKSPTNAAYMLVEVPEYTTVCINGWCADPQYYAVAPLSPTFVDLGDGVLYDPVQGVMWQSDVLPSQYPYQSSTTPDNYPTINRARVDCAATNAGGYSDWRLPFRGELHGWADLAYWPAQNPDYFPITADTRGWALWTATRTRVNDLLGVYYMMYNKDGAISYNGDVQDNTGSQWVRCVRTVINKVMPANRYEISASGESALDRFSGLIWQINPANVEFPYSDGAFPPNVNETCSNLVLDSQDDWRLPNNKEFASFQDEGAIQPVWNTTVFPNGPGATGWWLCVNKYTQAFYPFWWGWSGGDGVSYVNTSPGRVRCVRGPDYTRAATCAACPNSSAATTAASTVVSATSTTAVASVTATGGSASAAAIAGTTAAASAAATLATTTASPAGASTASAAALCVCTAVLCVAVLGAVML